jgi:hypothetical protein
MDVSGCLHAMFGRFEAENFLSSPGFDFLTFIVWLLFCLSAPGFVSSKDVIRLDGSVLAGNVATVYCYHLCRVWS